METNSHAGMLTDHYIWGALKQNGSTPTSHTKGLGFVSYSLSVCVMFTCFPRHCEVYILTSTGSKSKKNVFEDKGKQTKCNHINTNHMTKKPNTNW